MRKRDPELVMVFQMVQLCPSSHHVIDGVCAPITRRIIQPTSQRILKRSVPSSSTLKCKLNILAFVRTNSVLLPEITGWRRRHRTLQQERWIQDLQTMQSTVAKRKEVLLQVMPIYEDDVKECNLRRILISHILTTLITIM
uniref:AlNc14C198G8622 protein n=1 Tax=Albugo laibachii Nc14 TaxID=890382 RepID=F0WQF2_9STRA|nr:AlNc14C198G8622 [Albugo laibachii Nc14]|eukprot:CCA23560.1 AlNc14C198G8622 [Albugo laibachii Nc14]